MKRSLDENLFWELLENSSSTLFLDNDMCYISYKVDLDDEEDESQSFDFGPMELVILFAKRLEINTERV